MPPYVPLTPLPPQFFDSSGAPLNGGTLEFFISGTSTPTNIYSDDSGTVLGTSVTLNSRGYPESGGNIVNLFRDVEVDYRVTHDDAAASFIWTADGLNALTAADLPFADPSSAFTATTVEAALLESAGLKKIKTSDTDSSSTTLTDDPHLSAWALSANAWYAVTGYLVGTQDGGDVQFQFQASSTPQDGNITFLGSDTSAVDVGQTEPSFVTNSSFTGLTDSATFGFHVIGAVQTNASTGGTYDLQWAQATSDPDSTEIFAGSWVTFTLIPG